VNKTVTDFGGIYTDKSPVTTSLPLTSDYVPMHMPQLEKPKIANISA